MRGPCGRDGCPFGALLEQHAGPANAADCDDIPSLGCAIAQLLDAKRAAGLRPASISSLRFYLQMFSRGREHIPLTSIGLPELEAWFSGRREKPHVERANRGKLGALFTFAIRKGWLRGGHPIRRMEPIRHDMPPPKILTVDDCRTLLNWTHHHRPQSLRLLVFMLLMGMRPTEALRIREGDIRVGHVVVDAAASKTHRRRLVPITPQVRAWLDVATPLAKLATSLRRFHREARGCLGWSEWPQDVLRHSCASYLIAGGATTDHVADWLGNSSRMLRRHYVELATAEEARRFAGLLPQTYPSETIFSNTASAITL